MPYISMGWPIPPGANNGDIYARPELYQYYKWYAPTPLPVGYVNLGQGTLVYGYERKEVTNPDGSILTYDQLLTPPLWWQIEKNCARSEFITSGPPPVPPFNNTNDWSFFNLSEATGTFTFKVIDYGQVYSEVVGGVTHYYNLVTTQELTFVWPPVEPEKYKVFYQLNGTEDVTVYPLSGAEYYEDDTFDYTAEPANDDTIIDSVTIDGAKNVSGNTVTVGTTDITITVVSHHIVPDPYKITGVINYVDIPCAAGHYDMTPIYPGGQAWDGTKWNSLESGTVLPVESSDILEGEPTSIAVMANDLRSYISSFIVNGADMLASASSGLPDEFHPSVPSGSALVDDFIFFDMPPANVTFSVTISSNRLCLSGKLPTLPGDGEGGDDPIDRLPPGTEPRWPDPPRTPVVGGDPDNPPSDEIPATGNDPNGPGGGGGGRTDGLPTGGRPVSIGDGPPDFPKIRRTIPPGLDWDTSNKPKGLLIRWKDNNGKWGKWHVVSLGKQGDSRIVQHLITMGQYQQRQYEVVLVDRVPSGIMDMEEILSPTTETKKG